jgi:replicative superfamily II helicase
MGLKDLIKAQQSVKKEHPTNPKEIFLNELVHEQGYEYLRENQARFLEEWYKNKSQRDVVGILNTGAGKTLIGQLMLRSNTNSNNKRRLSSSKTKCIKNGLIESLVSK